MKNTCKTKGWPQERRAAQAERIKQMKPWEKTTGAKTIEGKRTSSQNALKTGFHSAEVKEIRRYLRAQKAFVRAIEKNPSTSRY